MNPSRARYGLILVILFSLAVSLTFPAAAVVYGNRQGLQPYPADDVSIYLARFEDVNKELPAGQTVGYLAEPGLEDGERDKRLFLTQYALIPRLVIYTKDWETVVGDFTSSDSGRDIARRNNLSVTKDFGNGVMILRNDAL